MRPAHRMMKNRLASFDSILHGELFRRYPGSLAIRLWNGDKFSVAAAFPPSSTEAPFVLVFSLRTLNPRESSWSSEHAPSQGRKVTKHSKVENRNAIRFHYDVSNDFHRLWPGRSLSYSCAYFERGARQREP
jgi:Mycolic acid cyclopropane synthetase